MEESGLSGKVAGWTAISQRWHRWQHSSSKQQHGWPDRVIRPSLGRWVLPSFPRAEWQSTEYYEVGPSSCRDPPLLLTYLVVQYVL